MEVKDLGQYATVESNSRLVNRINSLNVKKDKLNDAISDAISSFRVSCQHCQRIPKIKDCVYMRVMFYVEPYGCTGGDYWKFREGRFVCPHCEKENRMIFDKSAMDSYSGYFKKVVEVHER